jgi:hypothetical protein
VEAVKHYPNVESKYAAEGTVAHGLVAKVLLCKEEIGYADTEKWIGDTVMQGDFEIEITEEMIEAVWEFVVLVTAEFEEGCIMKVEERVDLEEHNTHLFGTSDVVIIKPFHWIKVLDFKYGAGIKVSAYENKQGMYYLTCVWEQEDVEWGEVIICQPRLSESYDPVSRYRMDHAAYVEFKKELLHQAKEALKPNAPRVAGDWCKKSFCPAFADCPATKELAHKIVARDFDDPVAPENLSISKIQQVLEKAEFIVAWVKAVEARAKELMLAGEKIPGYKLIQGYGHRKWQSEASVETDFEDLGEQLYEPRKLKSPSKLEKIIGKDKVADYAYKPEGEIKLVPESAKGNPLTIDHKADYD